MCLASKLAEAEVTNSAKAGELRAKAMCCTARGAACLSIARIAAEPWPGSALPAEKKPKLVEEEEEEEEEEYEGTEDGLTPQQVTPVVPRAQQLRLACRHIIAV